MFVPYFPLQMEFDFRRSVKSGAVRQQLYRIESDETGSNRMGPDTSCRIVYLHHIRQTLLLTWHRAMEDGGEEALTLLGAWPSPYVIRARLALNLKGLAYRYAEEEDLFGNKSELLLRSNPVHKKVPVLIHNGRPVCESQVIVQYIDECFHDCGPRLLPVDPYDRAVARFWAAYVDDKLLRTWIPVYSGKTTEERAEAARQVVAVLEPFEQALRLQDCSKPFLGGDGVGFLDVVLGGFLGWLRASEAMCGVKTIDDARTPLLAAWADRFGGMDGVKEVIPDVQRLVDYNKMRRSRLGLR